MIRYRRFACVVLAMGLLSSAAATYAQPCNCQRAPDLFDYGFHMVNPEAEQLAMILTGELRAPDAEYQRIRRDLELIRRTYPILRAVTDSPDYERNTLLVKLDPNLPHDGYDDLNRQYQAIDDRPSSGGWRKVTYCDTVHAPSLAPIYLDLPEVLAAEENRLDGGDQITIIVFGTTYEYVIQDCYGGDSFGCRCERRWTIDVSEAGAVNLLSYEDRGTGSCPFVQPACCLAGTCSYRGIATCLDSGGTPLSMAATCEGDGDGDGVDGLCGDLCPADNHQTDPGECGCQPPQVDSDGDGTIDCLDSDDDGDGIADDGDGSGVIGDSTCTGGQTVDCDDNCPLDDNAAQLDSDSDGRGDACDCAPADPDVYPGAPEINDGKDNQCPGDPGSGMIDEILDGAGFLDPADTRRFCWQEQSGASEYEVVRSADPGMSSPCGGSTTWNICWCDPTDPGAGEAANYLTRPAAPNPGAWGQDSGGSERADVCP